MTDAVQFNSDQLAFWNGAGGRTWVRRQAHTDTTLAPVFQAFLAFAEPGPGDRILDVGCGCGANTLDFARATGPGGRVQALDISGPMLAEAAARAAAAGVSNVDWREADASTARLEPFDLLVSAFGVMFFGDPVAAFAHLRASAAAEARMAFVCWRAAAENLWIKTPMDAAARHLPPRPAPNPHAPGMFAFADPQRVAAILTAAGWAEPQFTPLDLDLDIAAGQGLDEAVVQSTQIGAVNSWLRDQAPDVVASVTSSIRDALAPFADAGAVRLPAAMWLVRSEPA